MLPGTISHGPMCLLCWTFADKETERLLKVAEKKLAEAEKKFKKAAEDREKTFQKEVGSTHCVCVNVCV